MSSQRIPWLTTRDTPALRHMVELAKTLEQCVRVVAQAPGSDGADADTIDRELADLDAAASASLMSFLTALRSSYVTPLPRPDLYILASGVHAATQRVVGAGVLIHHASLADLPAQALDLLETIGRQAELLRQVPSQLRDLDTLEETWMNLLRASRRTDRVLVQWLAALGDDLLQRDFNRHREIAWGLESAMNALRSVNTHIGTVLVRES
ncbi:MAG: hypothetical protein Q4G34_03910 [Micrococcus sp.]|nr:hypothetical protein [Micrococcus sp.]